MSTHRVTVTVTLETPDDTKEQLDLVRYMRTTLVRVAEAHEANFSNFICGSTVEVDVQAGE